MQPFGQVPIGPERGDCLTRRFHQNASFGIITPVETSAIREFSTVPAPLRPKRYSTNLALFRAAKDRLRQQQAIDTSVRKLSPLAPCGFSSARPLRARPMQQRG